MKDNYPNFYWQVKEQLVREIREAQRWSAIEEAALALMHVDLMGKQMKEEVERNIHNGDTQATK